MANVNLTIDGKAITVPAGTTILAAAKMNDIYIPTLCFLEKLEPHASCRMCVVEVEGAKTFQHACAAKVREGMVVHTNTEAVRKSRKLTLQLLLSDHSVDCHHCLRIGSTKCADLDPKFCEMCFFCDCERDGFCDLQSLAREYEVDQLPFEQKHNHYPVDDSSVIVRNPNKCIKCKRCMDVCAAVQTVHNLAASGRGSEVKIGPAFSKSMADSRCIGCARCVEVCPTGAIFVKEHKDEMLEYTHTYELKTVAMADAALIPEIERIWPREHAPITIEQIAGGLKKLGFTAVVSAEDAKDAARAETEKLLDKRLKKGSAIVADTLAAKKLLERDYADYADRFVFAPSAASVFGAYAKETLSADKTAVFGPVGPEAGEAYETGCADFAINARELYRIMLRTGSEPNPGRAVVPEALPHEASTGKYGRLLEDAAWNMDSDAERFEIKVGRKTLRCAVCHNPAQLKSVLDADIVRVIA